MILLIKSTCSWRMILKNTSLLLSLNNDMESVTIENKVWIHTL